MSQNKHSAIDSDKAAPVTRLVDSHEVTPALRLDAAKLRALVSGVSFEPLDSQYREPLFVLPERPVK